MNEIQKSLLPLAGDTIWARPKREGLVRLAVLALAVLLFLPNLGAFGLWDPWETHYGEVSRNMVETHDWVSPWWGYRSVIGDQPKQGTPFFSKPVLIFWTQAMSIRVFGFSEWAIRLPMALMAIMMVFLAYYTMSKICNRRTGLLAALMTATAPHVFFLARQAQTDMPFVATMTVALLFFMLALFGPKEHPSTRRFVLKLLAGFGVFLISTIPQFCVVATDLFTDKTFEDLSTLFRIGAIIQFNGIYHAIIYSVFTLVFLVWTLLPVVLRWKKLDDGDRDLILRRVYLILFYVFCGHATLGKGLLGFLLPGAVIFFFLLLSNRWNVMRALYIPQGLLAFCLTAFPWYLAMFAKHGNGFYARFFIHDHFNRLGTGVHEIDDGTFEHFIRWLGIGAFPWVALVPLLLLFLPAIKRRLDDRKNLAAMFLFVWTFFSYLLFTLASTKFHHYIFPALPPLTMLLAYLLAEHLGSKTLLFRLACLLAVGIVIALGLGIQRDPQTLRNLFTYKYDRKMPEHLPTDPAASTAGELGQECKRNTDCPGTHKCLSDGTCDTKWENSQFWRRTSSSIRWLLQRDWLTYEKVMPAVTALFALGLLLLLFGRLFYVGIPLLALTALLFASWGLNYYLPLLSPHWSQKYVFEDYYEYCGKRLTTSNEEDYEPLISKLGLTGLADYLAISPKRVCPDNITSWLIVWRGETYYSYNELMPLEKKEKQLGPYLEEVNPTMKTLPASCGSAQLLCPGTFYVFMENRSANSASSIASQVNDEVKKIRKDGRASAKDAYRTLDRFEARKVHNENDFFTMFRLTPVYKDAKANTGDGAAGCGCAAAL